MYFLFSLVVASLFSTAFGGCYLPGAKTPAKDQAYQPCSNNSDDPMSNICCATNRTNPSGGKSSDGGTADICLPNGLCMNHYENDEGTQVYEYYREYCADINGWDNGNCLNICRGGPTGWAPVTPCNGSSTSDRWVCARSDTAGCIPEIASKSKLEVNTIAAKILGSSTRAAALTASTSASKSSATSAPMTSVTSSARSMTSSSVSSPTSSPQSQVVTTTSLSTSVKAGIGIGAAVGGLGLLGIGAWLMNAHTKRSNARPKKQVDAELPSISYAYKHEELPPPGRVLEANGVRDAGELSEQWVRREPRELYGQIVVSELPGTEGETKARHFLDHR